MAIRCGTTANGCEGKTGKYAIDFVRPDPSYVRYRYPGEGWREVKDVNQNLRHELIRESLPPTPGQCPVRYRFFTRFRRSPTSAWENRTINMNSTIVGPIKQLRLKLNTGNAREDQEIIFLSGPPPDRFVEAKSHFGEASLFVTAPHSYTGIDTEIKHSISGGGLGRYVIVRAEYLGMERIDSLPDDCAPGIEECTFRILGANNAVLHDEKRSQCPEAVTVPEQYGNDTGNFLISNSDPTKLLKIIRGEDAGRKIVEVKLGDTLIQKLRSPLGASLYPKVCWDCAGDDKCPDGTCEVRCGNHICCFDRYGRAVKTINK